MDVPKAPENQGYVYYWVSKEVPSKEEFLAEMEVDYKPRYNPKKNGMLTWEEYVEVRWKNLQQTNLNRRLEIITFDPYVTNILEVRQRIKERVPNFLGFWCEDAEDQIVTDDTRKIPLVSEEDYKALKEAQEREEPKLYLRDQNGNKITEEEGPFIHNLWGAEEEVEPLSNRALWIIFSVLIGGSILLGLILGYYSIG